MNRSLFKTQGPNGFFFGLRLLGQQRQLRRQEPERQAAQPPQKPRQVLGGQISAPGLRIVTGGLHEINQDLFILG